MRRRSLTDDSGQVAPMALVFMLGILAVAGLVIDGGVLFSSRRSLQSLADGAARAGAMSIDEQVLRESGGKKVLLDPDAARAAVDDYLELSGFVGELEATSDSDIVRVRIRREMKTLLLSVAGVRQVTAEAEATAYPSSGITSAGE